jgi:hypothetical protein
MVYTLTCVRHSKLFNRKWENDDEDKKKDFYKVHILEYELSLKFSL